MTSGPQAGAQLIGGQINGRQEEFGLARKATVAGKRKIRIHVTPNKHGCNMRRETSGSTLCGTGEWGECC